VLLGRGARVEWYTQAKARVELDHVAGAGVPVVVHVFVVGHVRHPSFVAAAGAFLDQLAARAPR
jgi:hypothetical protein